MPTAPYHLADGTRVPGATTIIGSRKYNIEGLLVWANNLGKQGLGHREVREQAADAGTLAHEMFEKFVHGEDPEDAIRSFLKLRSVG